MVSFTTLAAAAVVVAQATNADLPLPTAPQLEWQKNGIMALVSCVLLAGASVL